MSTAATAATKKQRQARRPRINASTKPRNRRSKRSLLQYMPTEVLEMIAYFTFAPVATDNETPFPSSYDAQEKYVTDIYDKRDPNWTRYFAYPRGFRDLQNLSLTCKRLNSVFAPYLASVGGIRSVIGDLTHIMDEIHLKDRMRIHDVKFLYINEIGKTAVSNQSLLDLLSSSCETVVEIIFRKCSHDGQSPPVYMNTLWDTIFQLPKDCLAGLRSLTVGKEMCAACQAHLLDLFTLSDSAPHIEHLRICTPVEYLDRCHQARGGAELRRYPAEIVTYLGSFRPALQKMPDLKTLHFETRSNKYQWGGLVSSGTTSNDVWAPRPRATKKMGAIWRANRVASTSGATPAPDEDLDVQGNVEAASATNGVNGFSPSPPRSARLQASSSSGSPINSADTHGTDIDSSRDHNAASQANTSFESISIDLSSTERPASRSVTSDESPIPSFSDPSQHLVYMPDGDFVDDVASTEQHSADVSIHPAAETSAAVDDYSEQRIVEELEIMSETDVEWKARLTRKGRTQMATMLMHHQQLNFAIRDFFPNLRELKVYRHGFTKIELMKVEDDRNELENFANAFVEPFIGLTSLKSLDFGIALTTHRSSRLGKLRAAHPAAKFELLQQAAQSSLDEWREVVSRRFVFGEHAPEASGSDSDEYEEGSPISDVQSSSDDLAAIPATSGLPAPKTLAGTTSDATQTLLQPTQLATSREPVTIKAGPAVANRWPESIRCGRFLTPATEYAHKSKSVLCLTQWTATVPPPRRVDAQEDQSDLHLDKLAREEQDRMALKSVTFKPEVVRKF